jgi:hypothetical protein
MSTIPSNADPSTPGGSNSGTSHSGISDIEKEMAALCAKWEALAEMKEEEEKRKVEEARRKAAEETKKKAEVEEAQRKAKEVALAELARKKEEEKAQRKEVRRAEKVAKMQGARCTRYAKSGKECVWPTEGKAKACLECQKDKGKCEVLEVSAESEVSKGKKRARVEEVPELVSSGEEANPALGPKKNKRRRAAGFVELVDEVRGLRQAVETGVTELGKIRREMHAARMGDVKWRHIKNLGDGVAENLLILLAGSDYARPESESESASEAGSESSVRSGELLIERADLIYTMGASEREDLRERGDEEVNLVVTEVERAEEYGGGPSEIVAVPPESEAEGGSEVEMGDETLQ